MFLRETASIKNRIAIEDDFDHTITYGELEALSREYLKLIPSRSLVFILCDYGIETVAFYYCMMTNHVVPLLLDKDLDADMLQNLVDLYQPQYLWGREERLSQMKEAKPLKPAQDHLIAETGYGAPEMDDRLALLLTTSGSTGSPKLVRLSYENLRCAALRETVALDVREDSKTVTAVPMNHMLGIACLHTRWMFGAAVCVTEYSVLTNQFWKIVRKHKVTEFDGVPFTFDMLDKIRFLDEDYPFLRFFFVAGGRIQAKKQLLLGKELKKKRIRLYCGYGLTETAGLLCQVPSEYICEKLDCIGVAAPGLEVFIENKTGEIVAKGPTVSLGYAVCREDLARGDDNHGVLHTGDIAYMDEDGFIYLRGRLKRFIKMTGARVSLDELESILGREFTGCDFACVGQDDGLRVFYTGETDAGAIARFCQTKLGTRRSTVTVRRVEAFPRNSSGKVMYQELENYEREDC